MGVNLSDNIASGNQWAIPSGFPISSQPLRGNFFRRAPLPRLGGDLRLFRCRNTRHRPRLLFAPPDSFTEKDTIVILYDAAYHAGVPGNYHIYSYRGERIFPATGIDQHYSYTDADGDSILNNRNALPNRAAVAWSSTDASGITLAVDLTIDGGKDNDLTTAADNRILASRIGRFRKAGDTLSSTTFFAYNKGDSVIYDPLNPDSCLIRLLTLDNTLPGQQLKGEAILVVFAADPSKNYAAYLARQAVFPGGRTVFHRVRGVHADSLYFAGDSVIADRIVDSSQTSLADTLRYTFIKGSDPLDNTGNRLLTLHRHMVRPRGAERERIFTLTVDSSVAPDRGPGSGPLFMRQAFSDGYWVQIDGSFSAQAISGDFTDSNGKTGTLSWDRMGKMK